MYLIKCHIKYLPNSKLIVEMVARFSPGKILAKRSYVQCVVAVTAAHKEGEIVDIFRPTLLFLVSAIAPSCSEQSDCGAAAAGVS